MGNNASSDAGGRTSRPFSRATGALGLSKPELEERCRPSGLYPSCQWEDRAVRKLIADGKLAARQKGTDARVRMTDHECPICFLHYSQVNMTQCCQADICTECYLQVRPQKEKTSACPFCNSPKLVIKVAKIMDTATVKERQMDEQKVIEAKIRAQASSSSDDDNGFGSNLGQNTAVRLMRARSESLSSVGTDAEDVASLAMTPEDRHVLEEEIRAQHIHPLARQVEREAEDRRLQNERDYYRSQSGRARQLRSAELRARSTRMARMSSDSTLLGGTGRRANSRNWNEIVEAFETGGNGEVNSLDDLVVLEAAILLSMAEEGRRRDQDTTAATSSNEASNARFDASQHAMQGFPLVQSLLTDPDSARNVASAARRPSSIRRARSHRGSLQQNSNDMSSLLLRGISEAEQIEMAIAMSLQQSQQQESTSNDEAEESLGEATARSETANEAGAASLVDDSATDDREEEAGVSSSESSTSSSDGASSVTSGENSQRVSASSTDSENAGSASSTSTSTGEGEEEAGLVSLNEGGAEAIGLIGEGAQDGAESSTSDSPASSEAADLGVAQSNSFSDCRTYAELSAEQDENSRQSGEAVAALDAPATVLDNEASTEHDVNLQEPEESSRAAKESATGTTGPRQAQIRDSTVPSTSMLGKDW